MSENMRLLSIIGKTFQPTNEDQFKFILRIAKAVPFIDKDMYSHNIISLCLSGLDESGYDVEKVIKAFDLDKKGWKSIND